MNEVFTLVCSHLESSFFRVRYSDVDLFNSTHQRARGELRIRRYERRVNLKTMN